MFGILLSKEIREHLMTFRFGAALVTTFILVVISVWILGDEFVKEKEGFENLSSSFNLAIRAATTPSQISPVVMRPLSPLSIFAQGPGSNMGNTVSISRWSVPTRATNEIKNNLLLSSMPSFDLLTIFIFVLSLFGILFSYDGFSGEREKGTLKILCTYPPSRSMLFTVKFTGCLIVISIPFLISFISALLILIFVHGISFSASHFLAIALILFSSLVYSCIFIGLGLLSSATTAKSSSSLALSLLIWTFLVVLIPGTSQGLARMTSPLLPADEIIVSSEKSKEELNLRVGEYIKENHIRFGPSYGDNGYGKENSYLLDTTPYFFRQMQGYVSFIEKINQERADQVYSLKQKHLDVEKKQESINNLIGFLSPATQLRSYFYDLTDTSTYGFDKFMQSAQDYRKSFLNNFRAKGLFDKNVHLLFMRRSKKEMETIGLLPKREAERRRKLKAGDDEGYSMSQFGPLEASYFTDYNYPHRAFDPTKGLLALIALLVFSLLIFVSGIIVFSRYDIR